jgi:predicted transcriptional regulator
LSLSKKQIETELNNKISLLQLENERLTNKYISAQEQINSMINSKTNNYQHMNIQIENDINYEKKNLISQKEHDESILFYQKQLEEANSSIMRLNNMVQNLEEKNQSIMDKCLSRMELSANKEVIIGLKRVIDEKEKTISNLYNKYDKLSIKYEDVIKQNGILHEEVMVLRNERVGSYQNYCNNNIKGGYQ